MAIVIQAKGRGEQPVAAFLELGCQIWSGGCGRRESSLASRGSPALALRILGRFDFSLIQELSSHLIIPTSTAPSPCGDQGQCLYANTKYPHQSNFFNPLSPAHAWMHAPARVTYLADDPKSLPGLPLSLAFSTSASTASPSSSGRRKQRYSSKGAASTHRYRGSDIH